MTRPAEGSLGRRLVAAALVWLCLLLLVGGVVLRDAFHDTVERQFGNRLDAVLRAMAAAAEVGPDGAVSLARPLGDPRFEQAYSGWYWQIAEPSGRLLRSRSLWDATLPVHTGAGADQTARRTGPRGEPLLVVERDISFPGGAAPVHLLIAGDLRDVQAELRNFDMLLGLALALLGFGALAAVAFQVRFGLRPLRVLHADLEAVRAGQHGRLRGTYPREVAPLAVAMNAVLDHDEVLIERARTHVGNLAHALKTPLAVLQAEAASDPDPATVRAQVQAMTRLVEHHLGRAAAVAGAGRALGTSVAVAPLVRDLAAVLGRIHGDRGLAITWAMAEDTVFRGQREDLEEILGNLMDNACKWAAGSVRVTAAALPEGGLTLAVEDDGPGLTADQTAAAARRGGRLDEAVPGWGLGLAIAADLAALNGATLTFGRSGLGGLKVTLEAPYSAMGASSSASSCSSGM
ncbi:ATP-binding protein [Novispirillum sp. DQ9]|uniref:ATP-binding protein n=1 Tax=Novispirillum sp. DQ9 TaxID=3398612 RepID=UPI003C7C2FDA